MALVGAFSVITNLRMELFEALVETEHHPRCGLGGPVRRRAQVRGYGGL